MTNIIDVLGRHDGERKLFGVVTAIVTNNQDPEQLGRVKVQFRWLSEDDESSWARIAVPMAGKGSGSFFLPDVDDEVLVAFEQGDIRFPYVLGALWRSGAEPPLDNADGENSVREIRTPAGLSVAFDDQSGTIVIADANARAMVTVTDGVVTIDAPDGIELTSGVGPGKVTITDGMVTIDAPDGIELTSGGGTVRIDGTSVEIAASASLTLEASGTVDLKGAVINLG
jgi:uncharacterized protein involved in type VI secretion and phage assembly